MVYQDILLGASKTSSFFFKGVTSLAPYFKGFPKIQAINILFWPLVGNSRSPAYESFPPRKNWGSLFKAKQKSRLRAFSTIDSPFNARDNQFKGNALNKNGVLLKKKEYYYQIQHRIYKAEKRNKSLSVLKLQTLYYSYAYNKAKPNIYNNNFTTSNKFLATYQKFNSTLPSPTNIFVGQSINAFFSQKTENVSYNDLLSRKTKKTFLEKEKKNPSFSTINEKSEISPIRLRDLNKTKYTLLNKPLIELWGQGQMWSFFSVLEPKWEARFEKRKKDLPSPLKVGRRQGSQNEEETLHGEQSYSGPILNIFKNIRLKPSYVLLYKKELNSNSLSMDDSYQGQLQIKEEKDSLLFKIPWSIWGLENKYISNNYLPELKIKGFSLYKDKYLYPFKKKFFENNNISRVSFTIGLAGARIIKKEKMEKKDLLYVHKTTLKNFGSLERVKIGFIKTNSEISFRGFSFLKGRRGQGPLSSPFKNERGERQKFKTKISFSLCKKLKNQIFFKKSAHFKYNSLSNNRDLSSIPEKIKQKSMYNHRKEVQTFLISWQKIYLLCHFKHPKFITNKSAPVEYYNLWQFISNIINNDFFALFKKNTSSNEVTPSFFLKRANALRSSGYFVTQGTTGPCLSKKEGRGLGKSNYLFNKFSQKQVIIVFAFLDLFRTFSKLLIQKKSLNASNQAIPIAGEAFDRYSNKKKTQSKNIYEGPSNSILDPLNVEKTRGFLKPLRKNILYKKKLMSNLSLKIKEDSKSYLKLLLFVKKILLRTLSSEYSNLLVPGGYFVSPFISSEGGTSSFLQALALPSSGYFVIPESFKLSGDSIKKKGNKGFHLTKRYNSKKQNIYYLDYFFYFLVLNYFKERNLIDLHRVIGNKIKWTPKPLIGSAEPFVSKYHTSTLETKVDHDIPYFFLLLKSEKIIFEKPLLSLRQRPLPSSSFNLPSLFKNERGQRQKVINTNIKNINNRKGLNPLEAFKLNKEGLIRKTSSFNHQNLFPIDIISYFLDEILEFKKPLEKTTYSLDIFLKDLFEIEQRQFLYQNKKNRNFIQTNHLYNTFFEFAAGPHRSLGQRSQRQEKNRFFYYSSSIVNNRESKELLNDYQNNTLQLTSSPTEIKQVSYLTKEIGQKNLQKYPFSINSKLQPRVYSGQGLQDFFCFYNLFIHQDLSVVQILKEFFLKKTKNRQKISSPLLKGKYALYKYQELGFRPAAEQPAASLPDKININKISLFILQQDELYKKNEVKTLASIKKKEGVNNSKEKDIIIRHTLLNNNTHSGQGSKSIRSSVLQPKKDYLETSSFLQAKVNTFSDVAMAAMTNKGFDFLGFCIYQKYNNQSKEKALLNSGVMRDVPFGSIGYQELPGAKQTKQVSPLKISLFFDKIKEKLLFGDIIIKPLHSRDKRDEDLKFYLFKFLFKSHISTLYAGGFYYYSYSKIFTLTPPTLETFLIQWSLSRRSLLEVKENTFLSFFYFLLTKNRFLSNYYKYANKNIVTFLIPSRQNIRDHLQQIKQIIVYSYAKTQDYLIFRLSPIIRGWCEYYKIITYKRIFRYCDYLTFKMLWRWCCRRHPKKNRKWIKAKYFHLLNGKNWVFGVYQKSNSSFICLPTHTTI